MAKSKTKEVEVEEIEDDDVEELEDLDDDVEEDEAPKSKKTSTQPSVTFGVADLVALIKKETGKEYSTRDLRTLIRKMARSDAPKVQREIVAGNRSRYDWPKGAKDPEVKAILAAVKGGEIESARKETLENLKAKKAKDKAEGKGGKKGKGKGKKAPEPADDEDEDDDE